MVNRPLSLSVAEIKRLPSVSRTLVLECGGNSGSEWAAKTGPDGEPWKRRTHRSDDESLLTKQAPQTPFGKPKRSRGHDWLNRTDHV
jgi:hypothetical protein